MAIKETDKIEDEEVSRQLFFDVVESNNNKERLLVKFIFKLSGLKL
jgi:hypothetical protein